MNLKPKPWLGRWYWAVMGSIALSMAGMIAWLLFPQPQAVIVLKPYKVVAARFSPNEAADAFTPEIPAEEPQASPDEGTEIEAKKAHPSKRAHFHAAKKPAHPPVLNLNNASLSQLQLLPGIGPKMAQRIVEYRKSHGPFSETSQIMDVKGIGAKKFEKMKAYLKI